ncbi:hypothetical protein, partial [Aquabacterium sp.]|uniref:hypothetical protein n=1 Tax=Aquabacterium sp. TaxID=1872578 RepID=UPI0035B2CB1E
DEDDGLTWINIRNPNDDVACASVKTYIGRNRRTIASQVLVGFQEAFRSAICVNQDPAPAASVSDEREAFDRWALRTHGKFALDSDDTGAMWDAWQARAILALRPAQAGVPDDIVKDAQRYRWLRAPDRDVSLVLDKVVGYEPIGPAGTGGYNIYEYRAGEELDAAIDAAMLAAAPKEGGAA